MTDKMWKWYVYELIDPRTDEVFYVGKGTGNRIDQHEKEANKPICSKKTNKINEIRDSGFEIKKQKVAVFWDEQAAYDHETDVIAQYGLENLTNIMPGGQVAWDRRLGERRIKLEKPRPLIEWFQENEGEKGESVFAVFADWFRLGMHHGNRQVAIKSQDSNLALNCKLTEFSYNRILPTLWMLIRQCEQSMEQFALRMKPYGVEVTYGRTQ